MHLGRTTLSKFLIQQLTGIPGAQDLGALLVDVAAAVKAISAMTAKGALGGYLGEHGGKNVQGETQQKLDVLAHEVMIRSCEWGGLLAGMVSEELEEPYAVPAEYSRGRYLLAFDPLERTGEQLAPAPRLLDVLRAFDEQELDREALVADAVHRRARREHRELELPAALGEPEVLERRRGVPERRQRVAAMAAGGDRDEERRGEQTVPEETAAVAHEGRLRERASIAR